MLRRLTFSLLAGAALHAAIWPEHLGPYTRTSVASPTISGGTDEYGLQAVETADYRAATAPNRAATVRERFSVTAFQFKDTTGAYAASLEHQSIQVGNYTITCSGQCPK